MDKVTKRKNFRMIITKLEVDIEIPTDDYRKDAMKYFVEKIPKVEDLFELSEQLDMKVNVNVEDERLRVDENDLRLRLNILRNIIYGERLDVKLTMFDVGQSISNLVAKIADRLGEPYLPIYFRGMRFTCGNNTTPGLVEVSFRSEIRRDIWLTKGKAAKLKHRDVLDSGKDSRVWEFEAARTSRLEKIKRFLCNCQPAPAVLYIYIY